MVDSSFFTDGPTNTGAVVAPSAPAAFYADPAAAASSAAQAADSALAAAASAAAAALAAASAATSSAGKANIDSPTFTGIPAAPTPSNGDNSTRIATTAWVQTNAVGSAPATVAPLMDSAAAVGISTKYAREDHVHPSDTSRASVSYVNSQVAALAPVTYVDSQDATKAPLASPAFTGTPTAPTAAVGTNTTQLATTAFVLANGFAGVFNVKSYGAVGDGVADDTTAIQNAVTAAAGAPVFLPVGSYKVSNSITSTTPVNIYGAGSGGGPGLAAAANVSRIIQSVANKDTFVVSSYFPSTFRDFQITSSATNTGGSGISMTGTSPTPANTTNSIIENVLFNNLYNALVSLRPAWTEVRKCSFFNYVNVGVYLYTTSGNEAAGGSVHDNYFYTTLSSSLAAIYSEVGYLNIYNNASFGSVKSVSLNISNNAAGSIAIHDNMFENFSTTAVQVSSGDGSAAGMVSIHSNQIQSSASTATSVILVTENLTTTAWLSELLIQNNRLRCASASGSVLIWVQAATKCLVSGNIVRETGANNPFGIRVGGATTNAGLIAPIQVFDNIITGTTNPYTLNSPANVQLRDVTGNTFAAMPSAPTNGSQVFVTDGTPGSSPLTGGGTGCMAFRQNGAWRGI